MKWTFTRKIGKNTVSVEGCTEEIIKNQRLLEKIFGAMGLEGED